VFDVNELPWTFIPSLIPFQHVNANSQYQSIINTPTPSVLKSPKDYRLRRLDLGGISLPFPFSKIIVYFSLLVGTQIVRLTSLRGRKRRKLYYRVEISITYPATAAVGRSAAKARMMVVGSEVNSQAAEPTTVNRNITQTHKKTWMQRTSIASIL
jgi:hypothetical protein